ncbi:MAG: AbrB/MazE/SpoVT family DNA-binding domain-containing protein [Magnetococcus sp. DMHC-1]|nr:AbrB/MazE/SpoVT family DNA-binding domain-containing protein [Magnetococcales bacterium]
MTIATMTVNGQVTIPKKIRDLLHLCPGDRVDIVVQEDNKILIRPVKVELDDLYGILHRPEQPVVTLEEMDAAIVRRACATMDNLT